MIPGRGRILLRRVESGESYPGGKIIIPEMVRDALMAQHAEVVAVGAPSFCEDLECERPHVAGSLPGAQANVNAIAPSRGALPTHICSLGVGDWVLVAKRAGVECGDDTGKTYLANVEDVLAVLQA